MSDAEKTPSRAASEAASEVIVEIMMRCMVAGTNPADAPEILHGVIGNALDRFRVPENVGSWRPGQGLTIDALYAWVATEPDGGEGVCAMNIPGFGMTPLVGADMDRIKSLRPFAEQARKLTGYPVRLVRFSRRDDLEILP
jgi:hypothetical protein